MHNVRRRAWVVAGVFAGSPASAELVRAYVIWRAHDALDSSQPAGQK
jgi:hypothetical protein